MQMLFFIRTKQTQTFLSSMIWLRNRSLTYSPSSLLSEPLEELREPWTAFAYPSKRCTSNFKKGKIKIKFPIKRSVLLASKHLFDCVTSSVLWCGERSLSILTMYNLNSHYNTFSLHDGALLLWLSLQHQIRTCFRDYKHIFPTYIVFRALVCYSDRKLDIISK